MAEFDSRLLVNADSVSTIYTRGRNLNLESSESLVGGDGPVGEPASSSVIVERGNWDAFSSMDQITVVRIDDCHIAELQAQWGQEKKGEGENVECLEVEYSLPTDEDSINVTGAEMTIGEPLRETEEEEEDGVYVIEYSNPEEEGESYRFKLAVDGPLPAKEQMKHPKAKENIERTSKGNCRVKGGSKAWTKLDRKADVKFCCPVCAATFPSNETLLQHEAKHGNMGGNSAGGDGKRLVCNLCPPPGKLFKKMAGLSVHLKLIHYKERKKDYFCGMCRKLCRNQLDLDAHTRRHANQMAVYQCSLCPFKSTDKLISGLSGRYVMKKHLESEHSGIIPSCQICNRNFKNLTSYLSDQFRHVGISPFYCPKCKIYEMTERGLVVHLRNDKLKNRREGAGEDEEEMEEQEEHASRAENSATDDSDS